MENRTLTDADIEALASALERRFASNFYTYLGEGFWGWFRKALFYVFGGTVVFAIMKGWRP